MKKFSVKPRLTQHKRILVGNQNSGGDSVFIGRLAEAGQLVRVDFDLQLPHVVAILGKRGSGKSYTLGSFLEGLCTKESQTTIATASNRRAGLLFDTLGIFQWFGIPVSPTSTQELLREQALAQKGWDVRTEPLNVEIWTPR